eukprot:TRINITY_DN6253_c0_g1_i1.p1 TRINITY_DN6253_c0_g1~~TRINITY_DN6253_c0_g1_i1.p1  ORF type:complete len:589 (-),score=81.18 TRINITY_DN6253_c0_g1_i1:140-1906(-)
MFSSSSARFQSEDDAATRIQSLYRGKKDRKKIRKCVKQRLQNDVSKDPPESCKQNNSIVERSVSIPSDYQSMRRRLLDKPSRYSMPVHRLRVTMYMVLEEPQSSLQAQLLSVFVMVCTLISIFVFILETMPELESIPKGFWAVVETLCTVIFSIEFVCRLLVCDIDGGSVIRFLRNITNLMDLLAILPFYLWLAMQSMTWAKALGTLRVMRLIRLFRIFKLGKYSTGLQLIIVALKNSSQALWVLSFFLCISIILFSSAIYFVERLACPDYASLAATVVPSLGGGSNITRTQLAEYEEECHANPITRISPTYGLCCDEHDSALDFPSIVAAFWWSVVTMTTVGFGEVYPRTDLGRVVGSITILSGILLIALPIAIIGQKFQEAYDDYTEQQEMMRQTNSGRGSVLPSSNSTVSSHSSLGKADVGAAMRAAAAKLRARSCNKNVPTFVDMSRRLRLMKWPSPALGGLAREVADEVDRACAIQKELISMHSFERTAQADIADQFNSVLTHLRKMCDDKTARARGQHKRDSESHTLIPMQAVEASPPVPRAASFPRPAGASDTESFAAVLPLASPGTAGEAEGPEGARPGG